MAWDPTMDGKNHRCCSSVWHGCMHENERDIHVHMHMHSNIIVMCVCVCVHVYTGPVMETTLLPLRQCSLVIYRLRAVFRPRHRGWTIDLPCEFTGCEQLDDLAGGVRQSIFHCNLQAASSWQTPPPGSDNRFSLAKKQAASS